MSNRVIEGCPEAALTPIDPRRGDPRKDRPLALSSPDWTQPGIVSETPCWGRLQDAGFSVSHHGCHFFGSMRATRQEAN